MMTEFDRLRDELVKRIESIPLISNPKVQGSVHEAYSIPVFATRLGDIENQLKIALAKIGLAILVRKGKFRRDAYINRFPFEVEIVEQATLNRNQYGVTVTADQVQEEINAALIGWNPCSVYTPAQEVNVATREGSNKTFLSIQFNFQSYYQEV